LEYIKMKMGWGLWLTPIILAIQEAENKRIRVQSQPQGRSL
jgi:hypothetical protein